MVALGRGERSLLLEPSLITDPERLAGLTATCTPLPVVLLVDRGDVPIAVRAIKAGAVDVLEKPLRDASLLERIKTAAAAREDADANE